MQTPLNISIPFPCHENWDAMTPETQGRHCKACDKVVVDFTNMSDEEIIIYLQKTKENTCGRMTKHQLTEHPTLNKKLKLFLYVLASVFLLSMNVEAQNMNYDSLHVKRGSIILHKDTTQEYFVEGIVMDEKGNPLDFTNVTIIQNGVVMGGKKTNLEGKFNISLKTYGISTIRVSHPGYLVEELYINITQDLIIETLTFKLEKNNGKKTVHFVGIISYKDALIDPSNPNRKIINKSDLKHMGY